MSGRFPGMTPDCAHIPDTIVPVEPRTEGCEECLAMGASWVHLRMCFDCGHVGCCDASEHHHADGHFRANPDHRLIRSFEPDEAWWYCFEDDFAFELEGVGPLRQAG